jgi:hypothetical protein
MLITEMSWSSRKAPSTYQLKKEKEKKKARKKEDIKEDNKWWLWQHDK